MTTTMSGPAYDLLVIRTVRDRILAGDWTQRRYREGRRRCLAGHLFDLGENVRDRVCDAIMEHTGTYLSVWNDTHTQAEVIALLDDVEDSLLGEMGVL